MTVEVEHEVRELLAERAARVQPVEDAVRLVEERAAGRSRRRTAVLVTAVGAAVATVVAAFALSATHPPATDLPAASVPPVSSARVLPDVPVPALVMQAALDIRREGTVVGPVQWVRTTEKAAAAFTGYVPGSFDQEVYLVEVQGQFVLGDAPRPAGASSLRGTTIVLTVPLVSSEHGGSGLRMGRGPMDLTYLGPVHTFELP